MEELLSRLDDIKALLQELVGKKRTARAKVTPLYNLEEIFANYPRKEGKSQGFKKLATDLKTTLEFDLCVMAAANFARKCLDEGTAEKFIPYFSTWVNSWRDYAPGPGSVIPTTLPVKSLTEDEIFDNLKL